MTLFTKDYDVDKMIAGGKTPYDDIPKHKLKQLLMSRDEEISTNLVSQLHDLRRLEKSDRLLEMARGKLKKLKAEPDIETLKDRNKWLKEEIKSYERGSETHMVITNNLEQKNKQLNTIIEKLCSVIRERDLPLAEALIDEVYGKNH